MSTVPSNNLLFDHIRDTLRNTHVETPQVEWSEIEVLLSQKQNKIQLPDKRYILLGGGIVALVISVFFIVRSLNSSSVTIESSPTTADTTVLNPTNEYTTSVVPPTTADTAHVPDSSYAEEKNILSTTAPIPGVIPNSPSTNVLTKNTPTTTQQLNDPLKIAKKKSKLASLAPAIVDTGYIPENLPPPDTMGKHNTTTEIRNESSAVDKDSTKSFFRKKNSKAKKTKSSQSATSPPPQIKKDSL